MRCRKNIFLLWVFTAVLATFMLWTGPAAARGQHALTGQSPASPHWKTWKVVKSPSPGSNLNVLNGVAVLSAKDAWAVGNYYKKNKPQSRVFPQRTERSGGDLGPQCLGCGTLLGRQNLKKTLTEHWDGSRWSVIASANLSDRNSLIGVAALAKGKVWAVGNYYNGSGISQTLTELYS